VEQEARFRPISPARRRTLARLGQPGHHAASVVCGSVEPGDKTDSALKETFLTALSEGDFGISAESGGLLDAAARRHADGAGR